MFPPAQLNYTIFILVNVVLNLFENFSLEADTFPFFIF